MKLRFTIRDLLWLTALLALGLGWCLDRAKLASDLAAYQHEMQIERKEMADYIDFRKQQGVADPKILQTIKELWAKKQAEGSAGH